MSDINERARQWATYAIRINAMEARRTNVLDADEIDYFARQLTDFATAESDRARSELEEARSLIAMFAAEGSEGSAIYDDDGKIAMMLARDYFAKYPHPDKQEGES